MTLPAISCISESAPTAHEYSYTLFGLELPILDAASLMPPANLNGIPPREIKLAAGAVFMKWRSALRFAPKLIYLMY